MSNEHNEEAGKVKVKVKVKVKEYIRMLRVKEWIKFFIFIPIIGAFLAGATPSILILVGVIFFCVIGFGFVINNYFDVEIDRQNTKKVRHGKNPIAAGKVTKTETCLLMALLLAIPIALSYLLTLTGFLFTLLSISFLTLYSMRYIRLKERFIVDVITHGLMFGFFPFLAGFTLAGGDLDMLTFLVAFLALILGCVALLTHQINDYEEDLGNSSTTVVTAGLKGGWTLLIFFVLLSFANLAVITHYSGIGVLIQGSVLAYFIAYPLYACRAEIRGAINAVFSDS